MLATNAQIRKISLTVRNRQLFSPLWEFNEFLYELSQQPDSRKVLSDIIKILDSPDEEVRFYFKSVGFNPEK